MPNEFQDMTSMAYNGDDVNCATTVESRSMPESKLDRGWGLGSMTSTIGLNCIIACISRMHAALKCQLAPEAD